MFKTFSEFINEDYNLIVSDLGDITFEDRWFYYEPDDEIIYGCDFEPVDTKCLFYFNPKSCEVVMNGEKYSYDVNNPVLLISLELKPNEVKMYKDENVSEYLGELGVPVDLDMQSMRGKEKIQKVFDNLDDKYRILLIYGERLIATTFEIIEEN